MYISSISWSCNYQLRQLSHIRRYLNFDSASAVVNSFVASRIGNHTSLLVVARSYQIDEFQRVEKSVDCLLLRLPQFGRQLRKIVRDRLHSLRVPERITYKLNVTMFKALNETALTNTNLYRRHLRSAYRGLLHVPSRNLEIYWPMALGLWPDTLSASTLGSTLDFQQFAWGLKTNLFRISYKV